MIQRKKIQEGTDIAEDKTLLRLPGAVQE